MLEQKRGSRNEMNRSNKNVIRSIHEGRFNNRNRTRIRNHIGVDKSVFLEKRTRNPDLSRKSETPSMVSKLSVITDNPKHKKAFVKLHNTKHLGGRIRFNENFEEV
jgi:hypothetical protein